MFVHMVSGVGGGVGGYRVLGFIWSRIEFLALLARFTVYGFVARSDQLTKPFRQIDR